MSKSIWRLRNMAWHLTFRQPVVACVYIYIYIPPVSSKPKQFELQLPQEQKVHIKNCFDIEIALILAVEG